MDPETQLSTLLIIVNFSETLKTFTEQCQLLHLLYFPNVPILLLNQTLKQKIHKNEKQHCCFFTSAWKGHRLPAERLLKWKFTSSLLHAGSSIHDLPNLLQLYASKATLDPHSRSFCIPCWGVIHSGKSFSYLSSNTSLDLWDLEPSVESGGTASWLSQPFEDLSCGDSKREGIKFQEKRGLVFEVEDKTEKRVRRRETGGRNVSIDIQTGINTWLISHVNGY